MGNNAGLWKGFLTRLGRNQAGNVLAIVAAALIPLMGLIGGGVDMSRAYMVRSRMQQACDAAALAGRRSMTTSSMTQADKDEAKKFFDFNFPQNTFGSASFTPTIQSNPSETTTVQVSATTTVPTTIMRVFGYQTLNIAVNCDSRFDIGNTDVMMVLDTTGSMTSAISDGKGGTTTRIAALQQAVRDFYDTLGPGSDTTGRIRYGFMPYSSTVNVGYQLPSSMLVGGTAGETWNYQTRQYYISGYNNSSSTGNWTYISGTLSNWSTVSSTTGGTSSACAAPADTATTVTNTPVATSATDSNGSTTTTTTTTRVTNGNEYNRSYNAATSSWRGSTPSSCVITVRTYTNYTEKKTDTATQTPQYSWRYGQYPVDVSQFIKGGSVANPAYNAASNSDGLPATSTWNGCIEERSTDSSITATTSTASIPDTAFDLQVDTPATTTATRWRPQWPEIEFLRNGSWLNTASRIAGGYSACPSQARRLTSYASRTAIPAGQPSSFDSYVNGLVAIGGTYHTIGMIWGARFLSPSGIFATDNATAPNGFNISRHIIFMTDGDMSAYTNVYGAWGYQDLDQRDGPASADNNDLTAIHNQRLQMMCNAIKSLKITIWVVGFRNASEGAIQTPLQNCATSSNHWMMAYDGQTLSQKFKDIAKNIGGLRLSQ